jgi:hypothetical protein
MPPYRALSTTAWQAFARKMQGVRTTRRELAWAVNRLAPFLLIKLLSTGCLHFSSARL